MSRTQHVDATWSLALDKKECSRRENAVVAKSVELRLKRRGKVTKAVLLA
jgi:hypothetical protein